jgi:homoserine kinase type II
MAVYTKLTQGEISLHLQKYDLGELTSFQEILAGIDNSNFILETTKGKFILTIFERRIKENELPFFINLTSHLAENGIPCPRPALDKSGASIVDLKDKKSAIVSFLKGGEVKNITPEHCFEVGKILAKMHLAAESFSEKRENDVGVNFWRSLFSKFEDLAENYQPGLKKEILENLDFLEKSWRFDLPSAPAHLDMFPDNVFFDENQKLSGVIDFYFAANDALIYDFAAVMIAWCDSEESFSQLLSGYELVRKFSESEKDFLKIALVGAAMRFLLTRLYDLFFTPKDSFVMVKDPQEYLQKLRFFKAQL